jgi:hypothetical protein
MKMKAYLPTIFTILSINSFAAIPSQKTCPEMHTVINVEEIIKLPSASLMWDCLDLSFLPKTDLLKVSKLVPNLNLVLSQSPMDRSDFDEIQKYIGINLTVDSNKFGRTDIIELSKLGAKITILADRTFFNSVDYSEISKISNFTLFVRSPQFTYSELSEIAQNKRIALVLESKYLNLTAQNLEDLVKLNPDIKIIP